MNVYLSVTQAKNIVFQLMEIIPEGVSICDESGILAVPFVGVRDGARIKNDKLENIPDSAISIQLYVY